VIFQFLVVKQNEHEIEGLYSLAKEIGVNEVKLKTAQIYDFKNGNELIPSIEKYARYQQNPDGTYSIKTKLLNQCWKMWNSCVITWDGIVVPCCFDKDADHRLGNLRNQSFPNIWNSPDYDNFRKLILKGRDKIDICNNCTEGCKVWESVNV
jgi:radical SAM protein with 4Fe4S-binding SPASM domain